MTPEQITAIAREYAEFTDLSPADQKIINVVSENFLQYIMRRYCFVEKSKATELCRLTLEHGDSIDYGLIDGLTEIVCEIFPEQYQQEAEGISNSGIAK